MTQKTITLEQYAKAFWPNSRIIMIQKQQQEQNAIFRDAMRLINSLRARLNVRLMILSGQLSCVRHRRGYFHRWFEWLAGLGE